MLHYNFTAFDGFEIFSSKEEIEKYRKSKLISVQKNISFVKKLFNKKIDVLEIGSGNSKFLYALEENNLLKTGYGVDVSKSRIDFANQWKEDLEIKNVFNIHKNILDYDWQCLPQLDLIYCVDSAFQLFEPSGPNNDYILLNKCYKKLKKGGKIILELDSNERVIKNLNDGNSKLWQEFVEPDPWLYLLWDCEYDKEKSYLRFKKTFIKRDLSEISKNDICLKIYSESDIIDKLEESSFCGTETFRFWENDGDMNDSEFLIVGEKR